MPGICATATAVVLYFGNSICGSGWWPPGDTIPRLLDQECAATVITDCSPSRGTRRAGVDGLEPFAEFQRALALYHPQTVVVDLYTNDPNDGLMPDQSVTNTLNYVAAAREAGAEPVLVAAYPINDGGTPMRAFTLGILRERVIGLGRGLGIKTVDFSALFTSEEWWNACTYKNGVHPIGEPWCRLKMAKELAAVLSR